MRKKIFCEILNRIFRGLKVKILKNVVKYKLKSRLFSTECQIFIFVLENLQQLEYYKDFGNPRMQIFWSHFFSKIRFFALKSQNFIKVYKINEKNQTILIGNSLSMHHNIRFCRMYVILKNASNIICTARYMTYPLQIFKICSNCYISKEALHCCAIGRN